jgi:ADP-ribosyl-[dinitrogen reductase] hydrolase
MRRYTLLVTFISGSVSAVGALTGLAIGDAMGAPFEGYPPPLRPVTEMNGNGPRILNAGQYTDDTLQAIAVAESLIQCRGFCPDNLMERLISGYKRFPEFYGPTSRSVFDLVQSGVPPDRAAAIVHMKRGGSRSNGSVMRGAPVGIFFSGPALREVSIRCSQLTHYDSAAAECSAWVNQMVSDMCRGFSRSGAFSRALHRCNDDEVVRVLGAYHRFDPEPGLDALLATHAAITVFMDSRSFEETVIHVISLGGDTDTTGAVAGALAGAWSGIDSIPRRWLVNLEDWGMIATLGARLWTVSQQKATG